MPALRQPNVDVRHVHDRARHPHGVVTTDGVEHPSAGVIFGTASRSARAWTRVTIIGPGRPQDPRRVADRPEALTTASRLPQPVHDDRPEHGAGLRSL